MKAERSGKFDFSADAFVLTMNGYDCKRIQTALSAAAQHHGMRADLCKLGGHKKGHERMQANYRRLLDTIKAAK